MSDDWQPGDLALCLKRTHPKFPGQIATRLVVARLYTVERVGRPTPWLDGERALGLSEVKTLQRNSGWPETLFVKITPGQELQGSEIERERFKQGNPWKVPA
jgi:hypothetical protein